MKHTILIVDDSAANIQSIASALKDDYILKVASSGEKALEIVHGRDKIDLIILDVFMPEMDGYAVLHRLQEDPLTQEIPVIFVTGKDTTQDEVKGLESGAVDYITKPIQPAIVKARVKIHMTIKTQHDTLQYHSFHDMLTGLYNRYHLNAEGLRKFARAQRQESDFSIIMVDIDYFKGVNDTYGHLVGDKILQAVANVLNTCNRVEDFVARFGGEEFIILLEDCNVKNAQEKAETCRQNIERLMPEGIKITSSFGVTSIKKKYTTLESMIKDADAALYEAKDNGRNRVVCYE